MGPKRCVISLATSDKHFPEGLIRLEQSLRSIGFADDFLPWPPGSFPDGSPPHIEVPFAFKAFCFLEAKRRGVDLVLWLDSSCVVIRTLDPIFKEIEEGGYIVFKNSRHMLGEWSSDKTLDIFGMSREQAMNIPEINAAAVGLNMNNEVAVDFLDKWVEQARGGIAFRGIEEQFDTVDDYQDVKWNRSNRVSADPRVRGHRHDQTVAGILAYRLGMKLSTRGLQAYSHERRVVRRKTAILVDRDVGRPDIRLASLRRIRRDKRLGHVVRLMGTRHPSKRDLG